MIRPRPATRASDEGPTRMNQPAPYAVLDDILRQTQHLLLDFDGPVCTLFTTCP